MTLLSRPATGARMAAAEPRAAAAAFSAAMQRAAASLAATIRQLAESGQFGPSSELSDGRRSGARA